MKNALIFLLVVAASSACAMAMMVGGVLPAPIADPCRIACAHVAPFGPAQRALG